MSEDVITKGNTVTFTVEAMSGAESVSRSSTPYGDITVNSEVRPMVFSTPSVTVHTSDSNAFLMGFLAELSENRSDIYTCIQKGISEASLVSSETEPYPLYYVGDSRHFIN